MKKIISYLLSMVMVFSLVPTFASNENVYMNTEKCYQNAAQQEYVSERVI